ncbi:MAG: hypothetical protein A3G24_22695 [Betaproteobacteria bacterium RIFCSPLOWO2_12_FULL_62_13]|nr:MAG: hypothetical protein A3G24_22695 [Betaproteobacteria bacterium RIFCSPLOWO2_12_FULL_62_13]
MSATAGAESLTGTIASYIERVTYQDIPSRVLAPIEDSVRDAIGCGVIGSRSRDVKILTDYLCEMNSAPEAVIWGTSRKACAPFAAAANAAAAHAWDFDDTVLPGIVHPAGIAVSTGLAIAEKQKEPLTGRDFLTAVVAGYEVGNLMSAALGGREWRVQGFYNTVPVIFGAAAVAGKLLGLDHGKLVGAIGIAATQASGLYSATMTKRLNAPKAVEGGIFAAELALRGYEAPVDAIGDEQGFLKTFSRDPKREVIPRDIGRYAFEVYHKAYPAIRSNHAAIHAARLLQDEHPQALRPENIRKITIYADRLTRLYTVETPGGGTTVETVGNALVSLPFGIAAMLVEGELSLAQCSEEKIRDPRIQTLLKKVEILVDPEIDKLPPTQRYRATVEVELENGERYRKFCPAPKGDPANRMSEREMYDKFIHNTTAVFSRSRMEELFGMMQAFEAIDDVREISRFLLDRE